MIDDNLPRYEHTQIVNALQICALEVRDDGARIVLHFYENRPPAIVSTKGISGVPALHSYMVTDEYGTVRFLPEKEFNVSYRRVTFL